ncbi:deazaflavin-dependent nitroreductase [Mycobacterium intermedium]|uniref:Deazaflavin-dependent nitroreductase n=1 Tax=Mycobacterium intermedium TaxID=28445 RepID=A0A1E3SHS2_MYCIE|nr:nitroreductase family deazaflavin-dependent oxidoreductase [Mycobacterium intermedium]MCV6964952.1 nitroreductase family deazaflavin-dependent oxidoreductase [Mycobacterium intermedium]ODR01714.1 deazaflavin-dependent nitroreductase [Mycobacterium intermedium]OPE52236.1 deazaflavin-dependent nitroreductase [Mycobacterium intermedium]ORA97241.1 deazaflavin-dependent nitroreductase [Mycobacterium intermedium]
MTSETLDPAMVQAFNKNLIEEFRANGGKVGGQFANADLLLLTTTGAKSGQPRISPLAYFRIDGKLVIVGSFGGSDVHPAWVHNLRANPRAHIEVGTDAYDVVAHELSPQERAEIYPKLTALVPVFGEYQAKTSRVIPVFDLQRA